MGHAESRLRCLLSLWALALVLVACRAAPAAPTRLPTDDADGWEARWTQTLLAAQREKLVIVTHPGVRDQRFVRAFRAAFPGIKVEHTGMRPSDLAPRVIGEQRNGQFVWDVIVARTGNMVEVLTPAGAFQDVRPFFVLPDSIDDRVWHGGFESYAQNVSGQPLTLVHGLDRTRSLWVNRDLVSEADVATIEDLLKPQLRGRILIDVPSVPTGGSVALATALQAKGDRFVRQIMVEQQPVYLDDAALVATWLAEGRYPVAFGPDTTRLYQLRAAGVGRNVKELDGASGGTLMAAGASVFRNAPHPNATSVFLNWLWSREGQTAWSQAVELNSRRSDVPPYDAESQPDYEHLDRYTLLGTQQGSALLNQVIGLYQSLR